MEQYDQIANQYHRANEERSDRTQIFDPTARHYLGDLRGLKVLDLACGSGFFTRLLKGMGATTVVGVDISKEMIELARQREKASPLGIEYQVGDVARAGKLGEFDVIFAGFLLHYAHSVDELKKMCGTISESLRRGGRFVSFNENPRVAVHSGIKYGVAKKAFGPIGDGTKVEVTHYVDGVKDFSFQHYHFEAGTYEAALRAAGLTEIAWKPFIKGESADEGHPPGYWDEYLDRFSIIVLLCEKE